MNQEILQLDYQMQNIISISMDVQYNQYLQELRMKLRSGQVSTAYVRNEIDRTWKLYVTRNPQAFSAPQQVNIQPVAPKKKFDFEFAVGAGVLSVVGILFILISFVMLGVTYMNGFVKGMSLYVMAIVVLLFSELFLVRKMPKFSLGITGLGISGLYLATMLNHSYLKNFNGWVAMGIAVAISVLTILISRKKDSGTIQIISFIGCYLSVFLVGSPFLKIRVHSEMEILPENNYYFAGVMGIVLLVNLITTFLPVKKNRFVVHMTHSICNTVFALIITFLAAFNVDEVFYMGYLATAIVVQGIIFFAMEKDKKHHLGNILTYYLTTGFLLLFYLVVQSAGRAFDMQFHIANLILFAGFLLVFLLLIKNKQRWSQYYFFVASVFVLYVVARKNTYAELVISTMFICVILLISKVLSRISELKFSELVITSVLALESISFFFLDNGIYAMCILTAFILSLLGLYYWKFIYEEIVLLVLNLFVLCYLHSDLETVIMAGIFLAGTVIFNTLPCCKDKNFKIMNYINLFFMACLYLVFVLFKTQIGCFLMLFIGVAYYFTCFRKSYGMNFRANRIILATFLCYMTLIWDIPGVTMTVHIVKSIILMIIAIGTIGAGFGFKEKKLRISGLVLTLLVCGKIVLYDFAGRASGEKMILFLVVGILVLAISAIYIALEKTVILQQ